MVTSVVGSTTPPRRSGFSGVVRLDPGSGCSLTRRTAWPTGRGIAMTTTTQLGMASGSKTFTALVVLRLVGRAGWRSQRQPARETDPRSSPTT